MNFLDKTTFHRLINGQHLLTPIAVDWISLACSRGTTTHYKTLYVFGIRLVTWRTDV